MSKSSICTGAGLQEDGIYGSMFLMKRSTAFVLTVGYLLLVPYCFFGASIFPSAHAFSAVSNSPGAVAMNGHGMPADSCLGCGSVPSASADHAGMYQAVTSATAMPFFGLLALLATLVLAFAHSSYYRVVVPALVRIPVSIRKNRRRSRASTERDLLSWLSLNETSPTFA